MIIILEKENLQIGIVNTFKNQVVMNQNNQWFKLSYNKNKNKIENNRNKEKIINQRKTII